MKADVHAARRGRCSAALLLSAAALAALGGSAALSIPSHVPVAAYLGTVSSCNEYRGLPPDWGNDRHAGMEHLSGGRFSLGSNEGYAEERPVREVTVGPFWIDRTEVTNAQFAAFVQATGYVTEVERSGSGAVFRAPPRDAPTPYGSWWREVRGADWRHPEGPESDLRSRDHEPVVQVARVDAQAYARWLGRSLPTEAQWEYAAKAEGRGERIERGPRNAVGQPAGNFWQGVFPYLDVGEDGYVGRAPVGCYAANGFHLHDMIGNVWEWTSEAWTGSHQPHGTGVPLPFENQPHALRGNEGLIKGGSFLCSSDYCVRYRSASRPPQEVALGSVHVGFRTVAPD